MPKIKGLRWWMIGLIMLGSIINYLTRSTLSVAAPTMMKDLSISTQQYSWIVGTFQGAIMLQPICGYVLDVIGLKRGYALFAVAWSFISMAHGLAHNWQILAGLRGLLGLAEGSANPAGMKATSEWFPAKERGLAGGVYNIGASFGSMLAPPLVAWAILQYNWQFAFVLTGALGLVWVAAWLWLYNPPEKHAALSPEEAEYISSGQEKHLQANDDTCCSGPVMKLLQGYRAAKLPVEAHIFAKGSHAFNMGNRSKLTTLKSWPQRMADWMGDNNILSPAPPAQPK